ncbi:hypothetical protein FIV42_23845 [Persicimonas caeni]|uniref:Uncharacterized protein n=1 Tax=Persicimonas caeni TaxID=2292766 RepID=A0A4Y6PZC2_PERCE|nr:hypothetical protein [Persicimonas caeni]QDG53666.1 hypothetical protein FIV42_23845 [Persicimonas caeni]QED34887.1 hypothetical protein FRD00_23840 [Persicimonas caeni]
MTLQTRWCRDRVLNPDVETYRFNDELQLPISPAHQSIGRTCAMRLRQRWRGLSAEAVIASVLA